jgi:hypothetical protein
LESVLESVLKSVLASVYTSAHGGILRVIVSSCTQPMLKWLQADFKISEKAS